MFVDKLLEESTFGKVRIGKFLTDAGNDGSLFSISYMLVGAYGRGGYWVSLKTGEMDEIEYEYAKLKKFFEAVEENGITIPDYVFKMSELIRN